MTGIGPVGPIGRPSVDPARAAQVRQWARTAFGLGDDDVVLVTELRCHEPGCPPVETVIAILGAEASERVEHRLHLPLAEVAPAHLWQLAAGDHGCCR